MGRTVVYEVDGIVEDWLKEYEGTTTYSRYKMGIVKFLSFLKKDIETVLKEYEASEDKNEWARAMGHDLVKFYNSLTKAGEAINTARAYTIGPRAFFSAKAISLKVKRGAIPRAQIATNEHKFLQQELEEMFYYADTYDKALLSAGVTLGYSTKDFLSLGRTQLEGIVDQAVRNQIEFPFFDSYRKKTDVICRSFLMPETVKSLRKYFETTPKTEKDRLFDLSPDALNDHLRSMAKAAGVKATGAIKWNLLRKFLFSGLLKAMDLLSAKLILGKQISSDLLTYFLTEEDTLKKRFMKAYPYIRIAKNGDRISKAEEDLKLYRKLFRKMILDCGLLKDISEDLSDEDVLSLYLKK
jgi:hypothetical protein